MNAVVHSQSEASAAWFAAIGRERRGTNFSFAAAAAEALGVDAYQALAQCAAALGYPYFNSERVLSLQPAFDSIGANAFAEADRRQLAVARDATERIWLLIDDPFDTERIDWAEHRIGVPFSIALTNSEEIRAFLKRHESTLSAIDSALPDLAANSELRLAGDATELSITRIAENTSPVVRLVSSLLYDALKSEASDVHLESQPHGMAIKYRIDGVLDAAGRIDDSSTAEQVISRIKVLAELDIAERRVPQDGRMQVRVDQRDVDLRVSIMPAVHGEDAVVRILDKKRMADEVRGLTFESLGFDPVTMAGLRALARMPYGLLLVTGPTGSGKTTTLYAALTEVNTGNDKIITIEDPVEYQLAGVVQIPVNEKRGLTFSRGLRSILRHDPDKIMVGEIRDGETGQIAVQAALTGHLVFTTVHANSVFDVIGRMLHIGVDPLNLVSALNGVVAQRLVRVICSHCAAPADVSLAALPPGERALLEGRALVHGRGCGHCRGSGYRGRRAIAEILVFDDTLRDVVGQRSSLAAVKAAARTRGMRSIRQAGLQLVADGLTTLEELDRVTFAESAHEVA